MGIGSTRICRSGIFNAVATAERTLNRPCVLGQITR